MMLAKCLVHRSEQIVIAEAASEWHQVIIRLQVYVCARG